MGNFGTFELPSDRLNINTCLLEADAFCVWPCRLLIKSRSRRVRVVTATPSATGAPKAIFLKNFLPKELRRQINLFGRAVTLSFEVRKVGVLKAAKNTATQKRNAARAKHNEAMARKVYKSGGKEVSRCSLVNVDECHRAKKWAEVASAMSERNPISLMIAFS